MPEIDAISKPSPRRATSRTIEAWQAYGAVAGLTVDAVIGKVAAQYRCRPMDVAGGTTPAFAEARHVARWLAVRLTYASLDDAARGLRCDRGTLTASIALVEAKFGWDAAFARDLVRTAVALGWSAR